ncbi:MAG: hypothetical protein JNL62_06755 [Bryobacterales bacterium]|nr:hypothetical protein [Bryobacterales bacterium]
MTNSKVLRKLRAGEIVRMVKISRVMDPWLTEVAGRGGFDVVWLDMEHRDFGFDVIGPVALACRATGMDLTVRVLKSGYASPMRALECGANGVMVPHCHNAEEAKQWVDWCRFPPLGKRGYDGVGVDADYAMADPLDYIAHANHETFLMLQIEDAEAVERADEIAGVEGVDLLFVGPGDLSLSYGVPMQTNHPHLQRAVGRIANAAAKHGKWWGVATGNAAAAQQAVDMGASLITCGSDHSWLMQGVKKAYADSLQVGRRTLECKGDA